MAFLEQLHDPKSLPSIIKEKKSRRIPLAEHTACAAEKKNVYSVWARGIEKGDHLEDQCVDGRMLLIWISSKQCCRNLEWIHLAHDRDT
jgi:hypothetical protein